MNTERYVECNECGHAIEQANAAGECIAIDGCPCPVRWTAAAVRQARQADGLPARYRLSELA